MHGDDVMESECTRGRNALASPRRIKAPAHKQPCHRLTPTALRGPAARGEGRATHKRMRAAAAAPGRARGRAARTKSLAQRAAGRRLPPPAARARPRFQAIARKAARLRGAASWSQPHIHRVISPSVLGLLLLLVIILVDAAADLGAAGQDRIVWPRQTWEPCTRSHCPRRTHASCIGPHRPRSSHGEGGEHSPSVAPKARRARPLTFCPSQPASTYCCSRGQGRYLLSPMPLWSTFMMDRHVSRPVWGCLGGLGSEGERWVG